MAHLDQIKNKNGFQVPEHYFENLENVVIDRIKRHQQLAVRKRRIWVTAASLAASFLIVLSVIQFRSQEEILVTGNENPVPVSSQDNTHNAHELAFADISSPVSPPVENLQPLHTAALRNESVRTPHVSDTEWKDLDIQIIEYYSDEILFADTYMNF